MAERPEIRWLHDPEGGLEQMFIDEFAPGEGS